MQRTTWTEQEESELWQGWKQQAEGITKRYYAKTYANKHSRSVDSVSTKLGRMVDEEKTGVQSSNYTSWTDPPIVKGDCFVLMDAHIPYHHAPFINKCLSLCGQWGITKAILGGDAFDANSFNSHPDNFENDEAMIIDSRLRSKLMKLSESMNAKQRTAVQDLLDKSSNEDGSISEEIRETRKVLKVFEVRFEETLWIMGNHEQRILKILQKTLGVDSISRLMGTDNKRWIVSPYFWAKLTSGGIEWQIEHPINSGKGSSKKLASKFTTNIIMGHGHHVSMVTDPSGKYLAIEPGAGADEERMGYVSQRHNAGDKHGLGAVIVRDGKAHLLNEFTDWKLLMRLK